MISRESTKTSKVKRVLTRILLPFAIIIMTDALTGHRALFYTCGDLGLRPLQIFQSPSKKYDVSELGFGLSGGTLSICAAGKFSLFPKEILKIETENTGIEERGPEKADFGLAWSKDETKVALIYCGWFVDFFDLNNSVSYRFQFPYLASATKEMLTEHSQRISGMLGPGYVIQKRVPYF